MIKACLQKAKKERQATKWTTRERAIRLKLQEILFACLKRKGLCMPEFNWEQRASWRIKTKHPQVRRPPCEQVLIKAFNFISSHHTPRLLLEDSSFPLDIFCVELASSLGFFWRLVGWLCNLRTFACDLIVFQGDFVGILPWPDFCFDYEAVHLSGSLLSHCFGHRLQWMYF